MHFIPLIQTLSYGTFGCQNMDSHGGVSEQLWAQLDQLRNTRTETPLRLYALDGELVSVLDALEQPLTPEMVRC